MKIKNFIKKWKDQRMKFLLVVLLVAGLLMVACRPAQAEAVEEATESSEEIAVEAESQEEAVEETTQEADDNGMEDAASVLPESWMAYPGSTVDIDYGAEGYTDYPAWQILVPEGTTYEDVEEYFLTMAEEQADFEELDASSGSWQWKGLEVYIEILKEDNLVYSIGFPGGTE
jgi:hypothetical protein